MTGGAYWGEWKTGYDLLILILRGLLVSPRTSVFVSIKVKKFREETLQSQQTQSLLATSAQKGLFLNRTIPLKYQPENSHLYRAPLSLHLKLFWKHILGQWQLFWGSE